MRLEEMIERKREMGYSAKQISQLSGVPLGTVQKIFSGQTKCPRYDTLRALEAVLRFETPELAEDRTIVREEALRYGNRGSVPADAAKASRSNVREEAFRYETGTEWAARYENTSRKKQGEYTLEDYFALPDERRVELIDGVIYDLAAPTTEHQVIAGFIHHELLDFVMGNKGKCIVNIAPTDVHPDPADNKTIVQPDVLVTCDRGKLTRERIEGAPDLVVEVLSPSTRKKDLLIKTNKYEQTGTRELWLVDPRDRRIIVYDFEHEDTIGIYTFRDSVPVMIFGGKLTIDFARLSDYLRDLFGEE